MSVMQGVVEVVGGVVSLSGPVSKARVELPNGVRCDGEIGTRPGRGLKLHPNVSVSSTTLCPYVML